MNINTHYAELQDSYLFSRIAQKAAAYREAHPNADLISLGIGDVTLPLPPVIIEAMHKAVDEMSEAATFRGYGPELGYAFLREAVAEYYRKKGVIVDPGEIFVGDGAKSDLGNILDLFDQDNNVLIPDPVYPVYNDCNVMAGRRILFAPGSVENNFLPMPDDSVDADIIYICSPNTPSGAVYSKAQLAAWVAYAQKKKAVILYDAAYEAFVCDKSLPTSIFSIEGARSCAIEFC
jgi:LL-diaminopimelate aminotransferase